MFNSKIKNFDSKIKEKLGSFRKIFQSKSNIKDRDFKLVKVPEPMKLSKFSYKSIQYSSIPSDSIVTSEFAVNKSLNMNDDRQNTCRNVSRDIYSFINDKKASKTPQYYNINRLKKRRQFSIFGAKP